MGKVGPSIVIGPIVPRNREDPGGPKPRRGRRGGGARSVGGRVRPVCGTTGGGTGRTRSAGGGGLTLGRRSERGAERDLAEEGGRDEGDDCRPDAEPDAVGDRDRQRPMEALDEDRLRLRGDLGEEGTPAAGRRGELGDVEARGRVDRDQGGLRT